MQGFLPFDQKAAHVPATRPPAPLVCCLAPGGLGPAGCQPAGPLGIWWALLLAVALVGTVLSAVHHAEVVAHKVGEPYGTLVLALAITVIEVALIVSMMLAGGPETTALARDTVFAAVMLILNGIVGLCLLVGGSLIFAASVVAELAPLLRRRRLVADLRALGTSAPTYG